MHLYGTTKVINNTADREGGGIYSDCVDEDGKQGLHLHDQTALLRNTAEYGGGFSGLEMCLYVYDDVLIAENTQVRMEGIYSPDYISCSTEAPYGTTMDGCGGGILHIRETYDTWMIYDNTADKAGDCYNDQADNFFCTTSSLAVSTRRKQH
jgi:predicted outer membrane repeat protein